MEKTLRLKAEIRERTGTTAAAEVRRQGRIPATVYGHKQDPISISLDRHNFVEGIHHGSRVFDVQINKKVEKLMVKDIQYDHLGKSIIHTDLIRVDVTETVKVFVPVELKGTVKGAEHGGILETHADQLEIECRVTNIPETIVVSVKDVDVGDNLHAGDVELPAGMKLISDPSTLIVTCSLVAAAVAAGGAEVAAEEAPVEPEVIGEKPEAQEESSQQQEQK